MKSNKPAVLSSDAFGDCVVGRGKSCGCLERFDGASSSRSGTKMHLHAQDTESASWLRLLELVEEAAMDGREVFAPAKELGSDAWAQILTLPSSISKLKRVRHLQLYGSGLLRIPPEIGGMERLQKFTPYTSYKLHWFPYEITRCSQLVDSTVSTRAIYGNSTNRLPFPKLHPSCSILRPSECSVCRGPFRAHGPIQRWTSALVATDVLPLLVHACTKSCLETLRAGPGQLRN